MARLSPLNELWKIRRELSKEMIAMSAEQRRQNAEAAEDVYRGLAKMAKIRSLEK